MHKLIIVMGPSGAGKSAIGAALAARLDAPFHEGDAFHSRQNIAKMRSGTPLTDDDRVHWVEAILKAIDTSDAPIAVLACSALTPFVQRHLRGSARYRPIFLLLDAPRNVLAERIRGRVDHFMPTSLLGSQLDALVPPEDAIILDASQPIEEVVAAARRALGH